MRRLAAPIKVGITALALLFTPVFTYRVFVHSYIAWAAKHDPPDGMIGLGAMINGSIASVIVTVIVCLILVRSLREPS